MKIRKGLAVAAGSIAMVLALGACAGEGAGSGSSNDDSPAEAGNADNADDQDFSVGIAMPTQSMQRWLDDGRYMKEGFEELGYNVDLQYAEDDIPTQIAQLENMITQGVDALVIATVDGESLTNIAESAAEHDIPIIAYDRLIIGTDAVDYYATFDNYEVGQIQARYIEEKLDLQNNDGPFNIEIFAGSPDDTPAQFFYKGAIDLLQPYIDDGTLVVQSGQTDFQQIAILRWDSSEAQARMDNLMTGHYGDKDLHAVLSPNDSIALGIVASLESLGFGDAGNPYPLITGQDAEKAAMNSILAGKLTMSVFKDTRLLAQTGVDIVDAILNGQEPEVNDTESYDNGVKVVPAYLHAPEPVDIDNYEEVLIDSGYYTPEDLE